jgi:hypothetical protein
MIDPHQFQPTQFKWQDEQRLRSGDRVWLITDVGCFTSAMWGASTPQKWYRAGGLDLATNRLGYFIFSTDDVRAMIKAGIPPAPWKMRQARGIELIRFTHGGQKEGRFREAVLMIRLDSELLAQGPALRHYFVRNLTFKGNAKPGMWQGIVDWAARENRLEAEALKMVGWFSAGDLKAMTGATGSVSSLLRRLVKERRLLSNGKTRRSARYMVAPPVGSDRADWTS